MNNKKKNYEKQENVVSYLNEYADLKGAFGLDETEESKDK